MTNAACYRPFGAFRFLLAMMVLLQHALLLLPAPAQAIFFDLELGALAVATFFALSGFIVAEAIASFYAHRPAAFLLNRTLRIAPSYLAALALAVAVDSWLFAIGRLVPLDAPLHGAPWQPGVLLAGALEIVPGLPAHRLSGQNFSFIPFAWTLRVEFAFYLAAALACWLIARRPARASGILAAALAAAYAAFAVFLGRHYFSATGSLQSLNTPFFIFGVAVFLARTRRSAATSAHLLFPACLVPPAFLLCGERGHPVLAWQLPILAALFATLLLLAHAPPPSAPWRRWDRRLGDLSYPLYISHGVALTLLASQPARGPAPYLLAIAGALLLAILLHTAIERPLRHLRTHIRGTTV